MYWPCARTPAETPKAVNVRLARETMEPRQTEFQVLQGQHTCQRADVAKGFGGSLSQKTRVDAIVTSLSPSAAALSVSRARIMSLTAE